MPKIAKPLSALDVKRLVEPGMHPVGTVPGLYLHVSATAARAWVLRIVVGTKRREIGLGGYPAVTLADAHRKARETREQVEKGIDPIEQKMERASALRAQQEAGWTFKECAKAYIKAQAPAWKNDKSSAQWQSSLEQYVFPFIGALLVRHVAMEHVITILEQPTDPADPSSPRFWYSKTETASRVRGRIESILDWATVRRYRSGDNPARWRGFLDKLLPTPSKLQSGSNFPALPLRDMGAFMVELRGWKGQGARALEFLILTAVRSQNVRAARWQEFDLEDGAWSIPGMAGDGDDSGQRMKAGRDHRVPLSRAALALLQNQARRAETDLVFPSPTGLVLSDMTISKVIRSMNVARESPRWVDPKQRNRGVVPHGFRSTFRDWAAEMTSYPSEMAEAALAHAVGDKVEAAYRRGDLFEKRREMMEDWAAFCSTIV